MTKFRLIIIAALGFNFLSFGWIFGQSFKQDMKELNEDMKELSAEVSKTVQEAVANINVDEIMEQVEDGLEQAEAAGHIMANMNWDADWNMRKDKDGPMIQNDVNKTFTVTKGGDLSVNLISGDINITTWDRNEVNVTASFFDDEEAEGLRISQDGNKVTVEHRSSWGATADLEIKVPSQFNLELNTTSGDIKIIGAVTGNVSAQTMGGDIGADDVTGSIQVQTSGGDIRAGDIKGENKFNTMGGDVRIGNVTDSELEVQTMGGDITVVSAAKGLSAKTYGGDIKVETVTGKTLAVTYGGDIQIKTFNGDADLDTKGGDIIVEKGAGKVTAKTAGGDINFDFLEGSLKAKTASGNIYAALVPSGNGENYFNASHGDITVAFPDNAKATVTVSLRLRGWDFDEENEETGISSDFQEASASAENENKDIKRTYMVNGGGPAVTIEAVNSEVNVIKYTGQRANRNRNDR